MVNCECCCNYVFDEEYQCFVCEANLDEDEMRGFLQSNVESCPYFLLDDEYRIVRKQM